MSATQELIQKLTSGKSNLKPHEISAILSNHDESAIAELAAELVRQDNFTMARTVVSMSGKAELPWASKLTKDELDAKGKKLIDAMTVPKNVIEQPDNQTQRSMNGLEFLLKGGSVELSAQDKERLGKVTLNHKRYWAQDLAEALQDNMTENDEDVEQSYLSLFGGSQLDMVAFLDMYDVPEFSQKAVDTFYSTQIVSYLRRNLKPLKHVDFSFNKFGLKVEYKLGTFEPVKDLVDKIKTFISGNNAKTISEDGVTSLFKACVDVVNSKWFVGINTKQKRLQNIATELGTDLKKQGYLLAVQAYKESRDEKVYGLARLFGIDADAAFAGAWTADSIASRYRELAAGEQAVAKLSKFHEYLKNHKIQTNPQPAIIGTAIGLRMFGEKANNEEAKSIAQWYAGLHDSSKDALKQELLNLGARVTSIEQAESVCVVARSVVADYKLPKDVGEMLLNGYINANADGIIKRDQQLQGLCEQFTIPASVTAKIMNESSISESGNDQYEIYCGRMLRYHSGVNKDNLGRVVEQVLGDDKLPAQQKAKRVIGLAKMVQDTTGNALAWYGVNTSTLKPLYDVMTTEKGNEKYADVYNQFAQIYGVVSTIAPSSPVPVAHTADSVAPAAPVVSPGAEGATGGNQVAPAAEATGGQKPSSGKGRGSHKAKLDAASAAKEKV